MKNLIQEYNYLSYIIDEINDLLLFLLHHLIQQTINIYLDLIRLNKIQHNATKPNQT
jgi:hypothetical protein